MLLLPSADLQNNIRKIECISGAASKLNNANSI